MSARLTASDLAAFKAIGVSSHTLDVARVRRVTHDEARDVCGLRYKSDNLQGIAFPYLNPENGRVVTWRVRRDNPEVDAATREPIGKYIAAPDRKHLYFVPDCYAQLADVSSMAIFVEAEKSVLAVADAAVTGNRGRPLVIGTGGCWGWRGVVGKTLSSTGARVDEKGPVPDLDTVAWTGRDTVICFDSNAATNDKVQAARRALASELEKRGASVRIAELPLEDGINGPDDFIGRHGAAAFWDVIDRASSIRTAATTNSAVSPLAEWPAPLDDAAFYGVLGDVVRLVEPHSEADPAALLIQALVMFGNIVGSHPHSYAGGARHAMVLYAVLVGLTSKGRKGTSYNGIATPFRAVDPGLDDPDRVVSGLSSGEGLIWSVRDPIMRGHEVVDPGVDDKRKLAVEGEFASVLKQLGREGNILSAVIRQAWDSGSLGTLTKTNQAKSTGAHIGIIGHVTKDELRRYLTVTEAGNGFGNRILWVCTKRSKLLPEGGELHRVNFAPVVRRLQAAVDFARHAGELRRDDEARALWADVYPHLSEGQPGMFGAMTSRAEAQVLRLACLYALADMSHVVTADHLRAALAVWRYCEDSARFIFGASLGDPVADEIEGALQRAGHDGLTRTEIRDLFARNRSVADIGRALTLLLEHGRVNRTEDRSKPGRPVERWIHVGRNDIYDRNDKTQSMAGAASTLVVCRNGHPGNTRPSTYDINDITPSYEDSSTQLRHTTKLHDEVPDYDAF